MEENVAPVPADKARKRQRNPTQWKRAKEKVNRYSAKDLPRFPNCGHKGGVYKCENLSMADVKAFFDTFYASKNKATQDAFLLKYCVVKDVKRRRPRVGRRAPTKYHTRLYVKKLNAAKLIPVCQKSFLGILRISVNRIRKVAKSFKETGGVVKEKRGGDHTSKKHAHKLIAVKKFIESFQCIEAHYCRSTVSYRKYLVSSLNIRKMWRLFCGQSDINVKQCYFRRVFNTHYNIGFGTPQTDVCSKCTELSEKIKNETDMNAKNALMIEKTVHKRKAKAFYNLLREEKEGMVTMSFDCQKNQVLPKIQDQIAYYSRQFYIYNFAIVQNTPNKKLNKDSVRLYTWTENEYRKSANEIASAVHHKLNSLDINNIHTIRLVADGCGAQNKNTIMVGMCATWLKNAPVNVKSIELVFPIPGHSFLPADRVFGNIERELKKIEVLLKPEEYEQVFSNYGTVLKHNMVFDWKSALNDVIKPPGSWHFQFSKAKRFHIKRNDANKISIKGEINYNHDSGVYKSILKRGKTFNSVAPTQIKDNEVDIQMAKLNDVSKLLSKHFGDEWKARSELKFYKDILESNRGTDIDEIVVCERPEPEISLVI